MIVNDSGKNKRLAIILAVVLAILQIGFVPNVALLGGRANLALVLVACVCLGGSVKMAPVVGFASGAFYDLAGSGPIGLMALILTIVGFGLAAMGRSRVADDLVASITLFIPVTLLVNVVYGIVILIVGQSSSLVDALFLRALPGSVLDVLAFLIVAVILSRSSAPASGFGKGKSSRRGARFSTKGL